MITLHQLPAAFDLPVSVSPFCAKLEIYLRLAKVEYEAVKADYQRAPNGKVPYITHEGEMIGDSGHIIEWAKTKFGDPLDGELSDEQRDLGHLIRRTSEEHLYWALLYSRFQDPAGWEHQKSVIKGMVPPMLAPVLTGVIRRATLKELHGQGLGRHDRERVYEAGLRDVKALSGVLRDKPFMLGDKPTSSDCSAFAMLWAIVETRSDNTLTTGTKGFENIVGYVDRMRQAADL